jgi:hypothetical protein
MGADGSLGALCRQLSDEPLWHVSLGSTELFHSNVLDWMCEQFPDEARQVLSCWLQPAEQAVMFALPDVAQVHRYLAGPVVAIVPQPTLVLLSLTDPGWAGGRLNVDGKTWVRASWRDLAQRLHTQFAGRSDFGAQLLVHEAQLIDLLRRAIDEVSVKSDDVLFLLPVSTNKLLRGRADRGCGGQDPRVSGDAPRS